MIHDLSGDFFRFLDALGDGDDVWMLYRRHYLDPHRDVVDALREQVLGVDRGVWRDRVERIKPGDYSGLRSLLEGVDLRALASDALERSGAALPCGDPPDVYLAVGFFSPDAFLISLRGAWQVALGLERLRDSRRIPLLVAHEYGHWARRQLRPEAADTLAERMASEGIGVEVTREVYPRLPLTQHLGVSRSRLNALQETEAAGWCAVAPHLEESDSEALQRFFSGVAPGGGLPPRIGAYLGHRGVHALRGREGLSLRELAQVPAERFFAAKSGSERV